MNKMPLGGNPGRLSAGNPLRQLKNLLLSSVIIVSRAAIRGGLNPELSYTLSDKYIQNIENCSSMSELGNINEIMLDDYIHRVHEVKVNEYPTSFVRDCISYVSVHLTEDLNLPQSPATLAIPLTTCPGNSRKNMGVICAFLSEMQDWITQKCCSPIPLIMYRKSANSFTFALRVILHSISGSAMA